MAPKKRAGPGLIAAAAALAALLAAGRAAALDPGRRVDQYTIESWDAEELGAKTVFALRQTRDGYLWIGTGGGLLRYDGFRFVLFEPANTPAFEAPEVRALLEAGDGSLWIGIFGGGVLRYRAGSFEKIGAGLPSPLVRALAADPGGRGVWAGLHGGGLVLIGNDGSIAERIGTAEGLPRADVRALFASSRGELWIGTERGGVSRLAGGRLSHLAPADGLLGDTAMAFEEDGEGGIFIATTLALHRFGADGRLLGRYAAAQGLASDYLFALGRDRHGNLWVGTGGGGIARFAGGAFDNLTPAAGLPSGYVWAIHEDRSGSLWVGTENGLVRLRDGLFTLWGARQGLADDQAHGVLEDRRGRILVAGPAGLGQLADGRAAPLGERPGLPRAASRSLLESRDGALWIGTEGAGVVRLADGRAQVFDRRQGLADETVWSLAEDRDGAIWAGTQKGGAARLENGAFANFGRREGLGADNVRVLLAGRDGEIWAGTVGGGLARLRSGRIENFTTRDGLASDSVLALYQDPDGNLWIGGLTGGLTLFRGGRFAALGRRRGFFTDAVGSLVEDDDGNLWIMSKGGPARLRRSDLLALFAAGPAARADGLAVEIFGKAAGFLGSAGTGFTPAAGRTRDGRLLFATSRGLAVADPRRAAPPPGPAPAIVEHLVASHRRLEPWPPPVLEPGSDDLEIHYTAPSLDAPERTRFRYRLEGFDRDWVEVGERRAAYYPSLPPGDYRFQVAAGDGRGEWRAGAPLPIVLLPRFYQTWWFETLLAALGALALYGLYRLRAGRLEARAAVAEERNRLAREIHDTIAQDLAAILMHARVGQRDAAAGAGAPFFENIAALAASSLAEARRSLQDLRPPALAGKTLAEALRETAAGLAAGRGAEIAFRTTGDDEPAPEVEAELLRIAKEAMHNALRHGGARKIEVELRCGRDEILLSVADDGAGFDPRAALGGYGLIGMRERAAALGGGLEVRSAPGRGAVVEAKVPTGGKSA